MIIRKYCPTALHLRAMNMQHDGLKSNPTIVIAPSSTLETKQLVGHAGVIALNVGLNRADGK